MSDTTEKSSEDDGSAMEAKDRRAAPKPADEEPGMGAVATGPDNWWRTQRAPEGNDGPEDAAEAAAEDEAAGGMEEVPVGAPAAEAVVDGVGIDSATIRERLRASTSSFAEVGIKPPGS